MRPQSRAQCRAARTRVLLLSLITHFRFLGLPCTFWHLPQRASCNAAPNHLLMCSNRRGTQCIPARHDASSTRSSLFHLKNRHLVFGEFLAAALKFLADACIGDRQTFDPDFSINSECLPPVNVTRRCHSAADMRHASLALAWHLSVSLLEDRACHLPITSSLLSSVHSD